MREFFPRKLPAVCVSGVGVSVLPNRSSAEPHITARASREPRSSVRPMFFRLTPGGG